MAKDPIVEEVRRVRDQFAREHGYHIGKIGQALRESEAKRGVKTVSLPPKKIRKKRAG
jgi:hypothetical protein